eukprot:GHVQ01019584.1.p1 GENE.GHVQ01019584.1~~GHVQ01019584.1.p1  ORF type:complete len:103 (-),score=4.90 GHVQ01019584.1:397-705(-)
MYIFVTCACIYIHMHTHTHIHTHAQMQTHIHQETHKRNTNTQNTQEKQFYMTSQQLLIRSARCPRITRQFAIHCTTYICVRQQVNKFTKNPNTMFLEILQHL